MTARNGVEPKGHKKYVSKDVHALCLFYHEEYTRLISFKLLSDVRRIVFVACATHRHGGTNNLCRQFSIQYVYHG